MMASLESERVQRRKQGFKRQDLCQTSQQRRRSEQLTRQREARRDLTQLARRLAESSSAQEVNGNEEDDEQGQEWEMHECMEEDVHEAPTGSHQSREDRLRKRRKHFSQQLMIPEWMVEVPEGLNGKDSELGLGWYVLPRPEGKRCLVISSGSKTISRYQSGFILHKFASNLPGGSRRSDSGDYCILDCIYHESDRTYYVLDMMCWKGYSLYDCTTDFRLFWVRTKLAEVNVDAVTDHNDYRFLPVPHFESDSNAVQYAYQSHFQFLRPPLIEVKRRDGLIFILKASHYNPGVTPCALVWKDQVCSRYFRIQDHQNIVLELTEDGKLLTVDNVELGQLDKRSLEEKELHIGDLVRCHIDGVTQDMDGTISVTGLKTEKKCSIQRGVADSWTKVLFYSRHNMVPISQLIEAAREVAMGD